LWPLRDELREPREPRECALRELRFDFPEEWRVSVVVSSVRCTAFLLLGVLAVVVAVV
jgi:hypothetical protein